MLFSQRFVFSSFSEDRETPSAVASCGGTWLLPDARRAVSIEQTMKKRRMRVHRFKVVSIRVPRAEHALGVERRRSSVKLHLSTLNLPRPDAGSSTPTT